MKSEYSLFGCELFLLLESLHEHHALWRVALHCLAARTVPPVTLSLLFNRTGEENNRLVG